MHERPNMVESLLAHKDLDVNVRDHEGRIPLCYAMLNRNESTAIIIMLLTHKDIRVDIRDRNDTTPLFFAEHTASNKAKEISALLSTHCHKWSLFCVFLILFFPILASLFYCSIRKQVNNIPSLFPFSMQEKNIYFTLYTQSSHRLQISFNILHLLFFIQENYIFSDVISISFTMDRRLLYPLSFLLVASNTIKALSFSLM